MTSSAADGSFTFVWNVKMMKKEELDISKSSDAFPWPVFPCRCSAVQTSLHACAAVCAVGLPAAGVVVIAEGDTLTKTQLSAAENWLYFVSFCYGCHRLSSVSSRIEMRFSFLSSEVVSSNYAFSVKTCSRFWCTWCYCTNPVTCMVFNIVIQPRMSMWNLGVLPEHYTELNTPPITFPYLCSWGYILIALKCMV